MRLCPWRYWLTGQHSFLNVHVAFGLHEPPAEVVDFFRGMRRPVFLVTAPSAIAGTAYRGCCSIDLLRRYAL